MPDVILWMICGSKRIAYYRIPAYDLLYSNTEDASGKICGQTVELSLKVRSMHVFKLLHIMFQVILTLLQTKYEE